MAVDILVMNLTGRTDMPRGWIVDIVEVNTASPRSYGAPGEFVVVHLAGVGKAQADQYLQAIRNEVRFSIVAENAQGYRIRADVNPKVWQLFGADKGVKRELLDFLTTTYGAVLQSHDTVNQEWAIVDVPKPADLAAIRADVLDLFEQQLDGRRYHFTEADCDLAVQNGGFMELTATQVINRLVDRLA